MVKSLNQIKILLVEDDRDIREMYSIMFMRKGFVVLTATDGRSAIQKYKEKNPDIILLDIMMPHVDGYQVLKEVRKDVQQYTPVIMLTNLDPGNFESHAHFDDVDEYLVKSHFSPSEVVEKTIEVLKINKILPEDAQ
ncbi:response regulator [Candidatus Peregrinibacteria bacterium CG_4_10_14_0_2_um_filter_43_11]|nr:MAG: response regulator [Candidatus Peregrinibacteria bacterium CG_4_10_14_0_2_um_filter_43_11]